MVDLDSLMRAVAAAPEAVAPGMALGHFTVERKLGAGGMGEVFAARDERLGRAVAIKLLPPDLAADPTRRARFEREARTLAALSHPGIVTIHAVEEIGGRLVLVMELVPGRPLAERIPEGGLPLPSLLAWARALAEAVGAAHLQGVTHRDLKPHNVMVTDEGQLKVLDFGLARAEGLGGESLTVTADGRVIGTIAYMSPEQAEGQRTDQRSDVFSIGIVLYEMAAGRRPFAGSSSAALLSAILRDAPPDLAGLRPDAPPAFLRVVRRCLEKDPARRYQSAVDAHHDLEELAAPLPPGPRPRRALAAAVLLGALAGAGAVALLGARVRPDTPDTPRPRRLALGQVQKVTHEARFAEEPSLAPDGSWLAFVAPREGHRHILRQRIGGENPMDLTPGSGDDNGTPAISPDGEHVAFVSDRDGGGVFIVGATGESPRRVTDRAFHPAWTPDGAHLVVSTEGTPDVRSRGGPSELWSVEVASGARRKIVDPDAIAPAVSPGGRWVTFWRNRDGQRDLAIAPLAGGAALALTADAAFDWAPTLLPDGRTILFASDRGGAVGLWQLAIDPDSGRPLGPPGPLTAGAGPAIHAPSVSRDGRRLAFSVDRLHAEVLVAAFDPEHDRLAGVPRPLADGTFPDTDGAHLVFSSYGTPEQIILVDLDGGARHLLAQGAGTGSRNLWPRLSADGKRVAFSSNRGGTFELWTVRSDGSELRQVTHGAHASGVAWAPDGRRLAITAYDRQVSEIVDLDRPDERHPLPPPPGGHFLAAIRFSPDGNTLFGLDDADPRHAYWLLRLDPLRWQHLGDGYGTAAFHPDGRRLLLATRGKLLLVDPESGRRTELWDGGPDTVEHPTLSRDGRTLAVVRERAAGEIWVGDLGPAP